MSQIETRSGGCHCGKVRYQAKLDLASPVISCNCSMCGRTGTLLNFVPADQFTLQSGEDSLTDYQFNKKHIHHLFCKVCGVKSFARGTGPQGPTVAVNTRCLDDINVDELKVMKHDGKSK
ncbi:MAG: GFA family protein [Polyangia bacterium]